MTCLICGRKLSSSKSLELGYGPVCYGKVSAGSKSVKKIKTGACRQVRESSGGDIPGQMELKDYLADF